MQLTQTQKILAKGSSNFDLNKIRSVITQMTFEILT